MAKIKATHFVASGSYLFVIDDKGRVWERAISSAPWAQSGELPDEPVGQSTESVPTLENSGALPSSDATP
jgi:hypothetical protein